MAKKLVNIGTVADDGTGDPLRDAFDKINDNFNEVYGSIGDGTDLGLAIDDDGNLDVSNDLTVTGDLVVNGTTTTISSETVTFEDNILLINKADASDTPYNTTSAGIEVEKTGTNPSFIHTFTDSLWTLSDAFKVDGNAGIGVSPEANTRLLIQGYGNTAQTIGLKIESSGGSDAFAFKDNAQLDWGNSNASAGSLLWDTSEAIIRGQSGKGLRLAANGQNANHIYIATDGDVGIGTSSPGAKLEIKGTGESFRINSSDANGGWASFRNNGTAKGFIGSSYHLWANPNNNADNIGIRAENELDFGIGNSLKMKIDSSGRVGIGTTSPARTLDVRGAAQILSDSGTGLRIVGGTTSEVYIIFGDADDNSMGGFAYDNDTNELSVDVNNAEVMRIDSAGRVGIGTNSPGAKLHIEGRSDSSDITMRISDTDGSVLSGQDHSNIEYYTTDGASVSAEVKTIYADVLGGLDYTISTRAGGGSLTERMRIDSSGNVGIGTSSPTNKLEVYGGTGVSTTGTLVVRQSGDGSGNGISLTSSNATSHRIWKNASGALNISPSSLTAGLVQLLNGNVGIGTDSPSSELDVNGTIAFNSLKDSGEDITITKFVDEADTIASNDNDTTIPTSAAVIDYVDTEVTKAKTETATTSSTDRANNYKIMGLAMDYLSRVNGDGGTVEGMENVMKNTEELILA